MPTITWDVEPSYTADTSYPAVYSDNRALPSGPTMANGDNGVIILQAFAYVRGNGASRTVSLQYAGGKTANLTVGAASDANDAGDHTGWQSFATQPYQAPGNYRFQVNTNGSIHFGRTNGGTSITGPYTFPGAIAGGVSYITAPTAPRSLTGTPSSTVSGGVDLSWTAPADGGGSTVTGYNIYRNGTRVAQVGNVTSATVTGTPGTTYTWTVRARNRVTDARSTDSAASNSLSLAPAVSAPSAPRNLAGTAHPSIVGATQFRWDAPTDDGGGIVRYLVYRDTSLISSAITPAQIADPDFRFNDTGLTPGQSYKYDIRAQNAWGVESGVRSDKSNEIYLTAAQLPSAPRNLTASLPQNSSGAVTLSWLAPATPGTGTFTGYEIRTSASGALVATVGNVLTTTISNLTPGTTYTYVVRARTALATSSGNTTPYSNSVSATPVGEPPAPTGVTVTRTAAVVGRLVVAWDAVGGTTTGYKIYDGGVEVADVPAAVTRYIFDGLTGTHTYTVRARNAVTDAAGSIGPASAAVSATPYTYSTQALTTSRTITDETAAQFAGTRTITAVTARTFSFASPGPTLAASAISEDFGDVTNLTNQALNGTFTVIIGGVVGEETELRYAKAGTAFSETTVGSGTVTDNTNTTLSGTATVTAADTLNRTLSYARTLGNFANRTTIGTVLNKSNAVYNVTDATILAASDKTFSYMKTNANLPLSNAAGTVVNRTVRDFYNGTHRVNSIPRWNVFTFKSGFETGSDTTVISNVARDQTMSTVGELTHWSPSIDTVFTGAAGVGSLSRVEPGTARVEFPAYPDGSVFETSNVNYTLGFTAALSAPPINPEVQIRVHVDYETMEGDIVNSYESYIVTEEEQQFLWTVPGTQSDPRRVAIYFTGLTPEADVVEISKPFLVSTPIDTLPFEGPYFDGDTPDQTYVTYAWTTSPHVSTRSLAATPVFGTAEVTPAFQGAASSGTTGQVVVKYRSGWIG